MENKDMISKRKTNKLVILLAVIFLASAAGLGGIYAWRAMKNNSSGNGDDITHQSANVGGEAFLDENGMPEDGSDITETRKASDVKTLRELLLEDGKFAIKLTDDIRIERSFLVNGTKKLVGDKSITMELYAEPFQPILKVQQGATLILDGVTLDGNSNASGVEVDKKAGFTSLAGTILYPIPYGVLNHGTTRIKDIKIDRGIDSGLCVMGGSKAYMEGGEISGCSKAAVHVVADGYVHISGNAKLNDSYMCINNRGTCEITGGVISDAWRTLIWNLAELTVDYKGKNAEDKLEWYNAGEYGIRSGENTETYISGVYIHDVVKGAIKSINHESLVVKNCKVENLGTYGVESAKGKQDAVFTDIEVINAKNSGVRVYGEHKVEVTNVTVTNTEGRGIQNGNSHVIAKNIKIVNSKLSGIYGGKGSTTEVSDVEIISSQRYGTENIGGQMTIKNAKITDAKLSGVFCRKETVNNLSNVDIIRPGKRGIYNLGGTVTADKILIDSPVQYGATSSSYDKIKGSLTISNLTVRNVAEESGLICNDSVITAKNVTITDAKTYGARVIGGGTLTITDIKVQDCGMRGIAASDDKSVLSVTNAEVKNTGMSGIVVGSGATAKLENIYIKNAGLTSGKDTKYTASYRSALGTTDGTVEVKNITIDDAVGSGVYVNGGTLTAEQVIVNRAGENGAFFTSSSTYGEAVIKMTDVDIQSPENRGVYNDGGAVELANVKITNPKNYGVTTALLNENYAGSVSIKGLEITGVKKSNALNCNASAMTIVDATISDVAKYGAYVVGGGTMNIENINVQDCGMRGMCSTGTRSLLSVVGAEIENTGMSGIVVGSDATAKLENISIKKSGLTSGTDTDYTASYRGALTTSNGTIDVKNITIDDAVGSGVYVNGGTLIAEQVVVNRAGENGAFFTSSSTYGEAVVKMTGVDIQAPKNRGIYNDGGTAELVNVKITNPKNFGVTTASLNEKYPGSVTIKGLSINGVEKKNALNCNASKMTIVDGNISGVTEYGAYVLKDGNLTLTNVKFSDVAKRGVWSEAATATLNNVEITGAQYGVFVDGGTTTFHGGKVTKAGVHGIYVTSANQGLATADIKAVTIHEATQRGVYNYGGNTTLTDVTITDPGTYGVTTGKTNWTVGEESTTFAGKVTATNLIVTGVQGSNALNCNASEIEMTGGSLSNVAKYAAYAVAEGLLTLNDVNISKTGLSGVYAKSGSEVKLTTVVLDQVGVIEDTETKYDYQDKSGIGASDSTVKAEHVTITNAVEDGIYIAGCTSTLKDVKIQTAKYGLFMDGGTITDESQTVKIHSVTASGAYIKSTKEYGEAVANIEDLTVTDAAKRAVYNVGAKITLTGTTTITNSGEYGITSGKTNWTVGEETTTLGGKVTVKNLTMTGVQKNNALNCNASEMDIQGGAISDVAKYGAYVTSNGQLTLQGVNISKTGYSGVYAQTGAAAQLTNVGITKAGLTVDDCDAIEKSGVGVTGATVTADTLTISEAAESGVYSTTSTTTLQNANISNAKYGVYVDGGTTTYKGGQIASVSAQGIYITSANNGLATVNMNAVTIREVAKRGVHNNGGNVTLTGVTITDPGEYGISSGKADWTVGEATTTFAGKVTATDLTVTGVKKNNALHCNASEIEVTGGTLSDIKEYAAQVVGNGKLTLNNVSISQCKLSAVSAQKGTLTMIGGTITGTTGYDVDLKEPNGTASVTLTGVNITRAEGNAHGSMILARGIKNKETGEEYDGTTTLTLDNCSLTGSGTPTTESAITVTKGTLNIQNGGTYKDNASAVRASVIYVASTGNVNINQGETKSLVSFINNGCDSGASAASGGVINVQNGGIFKADTCAFTSNYVKCSGTGTCTGGAISVGSETDGNVVIKNATFDGNFIDATKGYGGAVSVGSSGYLTMENCVFGQTTANVANYGKDVRGADSTVFNLSGKIVAEFFNTQYVHTLRVVDHLTEDSNIVMKWNQNKISNVEEEVVIRFANSDLVTKTNKACFALHEVHESTHKFAFGSTVGKIRKK